MQRVCFQLQVKPDARRARRDRLAQLHALNSPAGVVIGFLECDDFEAARKAMEQTDVNARWQAEMASFFEGLDGQRPDEGLLQLEEIFHLD